MTYRIEFPKKLCSYFDYMTKEFVKRLEIYRACNCANYNRGNANFSLRP